MAIDERAARFVEHLRPLRDQLEHYCRRSLYDANAVEDVLQSAVMDAYRDFHLYVENTNFRAWIFRYLNLEILEHNTRHASSRQVPLSNLEQAGEIGVQQSERAFEQLLAEPDAVLEQCDGPIADALAELGERDRAVLLLRAIGEFKYAEIAGILEIPLGTVMSCLARTRQRLRTRLANFARQQGLQEE